MTLGLILSGGGARGAYEIGVLGWILDQLGDRRDGAHPFDVIAGTSAGALNAAFFAGASGEGPAAAHHAAALWEQLQLSDLTGRGVSRLGWAMRALRGGRVPAGVLDPRPLARLVEREIRWDALHQHLASGRLRALAISATRVATGACVAFVEAAPGVAVSARLGPRVEAHPGPIEPAHVLASSAIPLLFAPVEVGGELYCEGGLRLNTPLAPAIRLGADRLLVVAVSAEAPAPPLDPAHAPSAPFLLGKVLDAFLIDHVLQDLEHLDQTNQLLADGAAAFGPRFIDRLRLEAERHGREGPRPVARLVMRPSVDLAELARHHLRDRRMRLVGDVGRGLLALLEASDGAELASYLLFDAPFTRALVALGRRDAEARGAELLEFLGHPARRAAS